MKVGQVLGRRYVRQFYGFHMGGGEDRRKGRWVAQIHSFTHVFRGPPSIYRNIEFAQVKCVFNILYICQIPTVNLLIFANTVIFKVCNYVMKIIHDKTSRDFLLRITNLKIPAVCTVHSNTLTNRFASDNDNRITTTALGGGGGTSFS